MKNHVNGLLSAMYQLSLISLAPTLAILLIMIAPKHTFAGVAVGTLYAVDGSAGHLATLYTLDPTDGSILSTIGLILDTADGTTQLEHVTGIAVDPTNGQMYGVTNSSGPSGHNLWSINKATGAATVIGPLGHNIPDISFDPFGNLYGWSEFSGSRTDDLVTINKSTGAATIVGECEANGFSAECDTFQTGFAIDSNANFYMKNSDVLVRINPLNGAAFSFTDLDSTRFDNLAPCNMLAFDENDNLFTGRRLVDPAFDCSNFSSSGDTNDSSLESVNITGGTLNQLGTNNISYLTAIEFDRFGLIAPPDIDGAVDLIVHGNTRASSSRKGFAVVVINEASSEFTVSTANIDVKVNLSSDDLTCTDTTKTLSPGRMARFRCTFDPSARGISAGENVMYDATLNIYGDNNIANDSDSQTQVAQ